MITDSVASGPQHVCFNEKRKANGWMRRNLPLSKYGKQITCSMHLLQDGHLGEEPVAVGKYMSQRMHQDRHNY